jgi:hypothetical protein
MADEIAQAQLDLGQALNRARAGEDKALARKVRELGEQFARLLYGMLRMCRIHALDNKAFNDPLVELTRALAGLHEMLGAVHIICVEDQVYVNDVRIRFDIAGEHVAGLGDELRRHNVGGLSFNTVLDEPDIRKLVRSLTERPEPRRPRQALQSRLNDEGLASVELQAVFRFRVKGDTEHPAHRDYGSIYQACATVVAETYANLMSARVPNPLPVRRMVNELVDLARTTDAARMAAEQDESLPNFARHTLMVTSLSLLIGLQAGLSDAALGDLGVAAIFHDVGAMLREGGAPVPFARHGSAGLRSLMRQRGFHEAKIRRLLAVIEHHRAFSGDPPRPTLMSRIIHIADDYDILTRFRPGQGPILAQPDAVARMAAQAPPAYDPVLFQCFVNAIGIFPPGSVLRLNSGRLVTSISGVRTPESFAKPLCRVLRNADGSAASGTDVVDLAVEDEVKRVVMPSA